MRFNTFEATNNKGKEEQNKCDIVQEKKSPNYWALVDAVGNLEHRKRKTSKKRDFYPR